MAMLNAATNPNYGALANAPKEIGLLMRVEGVRSGLQEISARLDTFAAKLNGIPTSEASPQPAPCGLPANLSEMEAHVRSIMATLGQLHDAI